MQLSSPNFAFLAKHDDLLVRYAMLAERCVFDDPNSSLIKQRQLAEALARQAAANVGTAVHPQDDFAEVLRLLKDRNAVSTEGADLFTSFERRETRRRTRYLRFNRTGERIDETLRSVVNGLIRQDRLERDGSRIRSL